MRRRLLVVATNPAEVVRCAGGWLFDQVMAGWDVTVLTAGRADARPLRILGVRAAELEPVLASPVRGPWPHAIAVRADLLGSDERVRRLVLDALELGRSEVRLWGDECAASFDSDVTDVTGAAGPISHRLSLAARAFKAQALTAAAVTGARAQVPVADSREATEVFRSGHLLRQSART